MGVSSTKCPKCGGILMVGSYLGEWYENCVQCGNLVFLEKHTPAPAGKSVPADGKWESLLEEAKGGSPRRSKPSARSRRR